MAISPSIDIISATEIQFRTFQKTDLDEVIALHRSAIADFHIGIDAATEEFDLEDIEESYLKAGGEFLVGVLKNQIVAMGGFRRVEAQKAELKRMRILPEFQGHGIGSLLLKKLEVGAKDSGIQVLFLETAKQRARTLDFYLRHGYTETGEGFYGEVAVVYFEKWL